MSYILLLLSLGSNVVFSHDHAQEHRKIEAAEFALNELRKISDSGIYNTLSLSKIISFSEEDGIFHDNIILQLEIASPHFKSKKSVETFEVFVMRHKEDGTRSVAIDEFPAMDEDAIESFWIQKVENKRRDREQAFRRMEIEALLVNDEAHLNEVEKEEITEKLKEQSIEELLDIVDRTQSVEGVASRELASKIVAERLGNEDISAEEAALASLPLRELYAISIGDYVDATDYQILRAKELLDVALTRAGGR